MLDNPLVGIGTIDRQNDKPLHQQIANLLENAIRNRVYKQGTKIPGARLIANYYRVAHGTANQALILLTQRGLVVPIARQAGAGHYVTGKLPNGEDSQ
jgi:DNA-binding GntR family transcriptional regulator